MKNLLENKHCNINILRRCSGCKSEQDLKLDLKDTKILIEYRFKHFDSDKIADVACLDLEDKIKYVFEICYKHKTLNGTRPEPWFEFDAEELLECKIEDKESTFDNENKIIDLKNKLSLYCIRDIGYCDKCKCTGDGKCMSLNSLNKIYDCKFDCVPIKCKYNKCNVRFPKYYDVRRGYCIDCDMYRFSNFTYLNVPYRYKEKAKSMGAKWDNDEKKWYIIKNSEYNKDILKEFPVILRRY